MGKAKGVGDTVFKTVTVLSVLLVMAVLCFALLAEQVDPVRAYQLVFANIEQSGVTNPVTAVLLNFRAYDTFIELAVFFCVTIAVLPFLQNDPPSEISFRDESLLLQSCKVFIPPTILVSGYLLWVGASAPGGAFQAAALLAGCLVLVSLANAKSIDLSSCMVRGVLMSGVAVFALVFLLTSLGNALPLNYPLDEAGLIILFIEFWATLGVALSLFVCFESIHRGHT